MNRHLPHRSGRRAACALLLLAPLLARTEPRSVQVRLVGGRVQAGDASLRFKRGDAVELVVESDRRILLHLHGYDIEKRAAPGADARFVFTARLAGRFPVSEHAHGPHGHKALFYIEVHP